MPKDDNQIDFGLDNLDFGLSFGEKKQNNTKKDGNKKDDFGMNQLADEMKGDLTRTIQEFKEDFLPLKEDVLAIKKEYIDPINNFFKEKKAKKELKNIQAFSREVAFKRKEKERKMIGVQGDH